MVVAVSGAALAQSLTPGCQISISAPRRTTERLNPSARRPSLVISERSSACVFETDQCPLASLVIEVDLPGR